VPGSSLKGGSVHEILKLFLETQRREAMQLAAASDLLEVTAIDPQRYFATFRCRGLVQNARGEVREHDRFSVGIWLPESYLRVANPAEILTWLEPKTVWHPNIRSPFVCLGKIAPGTPLVDLLHRCFELISFQNVTMREDDALNQPACAWARRNRERFPVDSRPIKRQAAEAAPC
jgi:hypothetical protein